MALVHGVKAEMTEQEPPVMADATNNSIELILVRMEAKIDRQGDRMVRYEQDVTGLRQRVHDMANELTLLTMLNLPDRIRTADMNKADHDARIQGLENVEQQRKGAAQFAKALWAIMGAVGVAGVSAIVRLFQTGGHL